MPCRLPHTAEEFQRFIKAQSENSDIDHRKAILKVIERFEIAKQLIREDRERYTECPDLSDDRKYVIDSFLYDQYRKDAAMVESLWACVYQLEAQVADKVRWSFEENVESDKVEQQQQQQQQPQQQLLSQPPQGASSSSAPKDIEQPPLPHLDNFQSSFEESVAVADDGWNSDKERELSRMEAELEAENLASFNPYDDGYDSNNSQTWDHPDYY